MPILMGTIPKALVPNKMKKRKKREDPPKRIKKGGKKRGSK